MSDFNDDNAKLDAAIKANVDAITAEAAARAASVTALTEKAGMQLLDTQSVPASTGDWSVELGAVDWSAWSTVRVVCVPVLSADGRYDLSISGQTCATSSKGACQIHLHPSFRTDLPAAGTCWAPGTVPASFIAGSFQSATIRLWCREGTLEPGTTAWIWGMKYEHTPRSFRSGALVVSAPRRFDHWVLLIRQRSRCKAQRNRTQESQ